MVEAQVPIVPRAPVEYSGRRIFQNQIEIGIRVILHRSCDVFQRSIGHQIRKKQTEGLYLYLAQGGGALFAPQPWENAIFMMKR